MPHPVGSCGAANGDQVHGALVERAVLVGDRLEGPGRDGAAVLVPESDVRVFSDPFFAHVHHGVMGAFTDHSAHVVLATLKEGETAESMRDYFTSGRMDGGIVVSHHGAGLARALAAVTQPVVFVGNPGAPGFSYVDLRQEIAAAAAVRHLVERGARRIATITGPLDMPAGRGRYTGFIAGVSGAGLEPAGVVHGMFTSDSGAAGAEALLETAPDLDGLFVASDLMAAGALRVLASRGRRVPQDVRVIDSTTLRSPARRRRH